MQKLECESVSKWSDWRWAVALISRVSSRRSVFMIF